MRQHAKVEQPSKHKTKRVTFVMPSRIYNRLITYCDNSRPQFTFASLMNLWIAEGMERAGINMVNAEPGPEDLRSIAIGVWTDHQIDANAALVKQRVAERRARGCEQCGAVGVYDEAGQSWYCGCEFGVAKQAADDALAAATDEA